VGYSHITEEVVKDRIQKWLKQASRRKQDLFPEEEFSIPDDVLLMD
jgi:hypothetical protein